MKTIARAVLQTCTPLVAVSALGLLAGCLYGGDPGDIEVDLSQPASLDGVDVELIRHSTSCDSAESPGLVAKVGPWLEYPAEAVGGLTASCSPAPHPSVEVHIDDSALIFDFSNVQEPGRFPDGEFEGYILDIVRDADSPVLVAALVDSHNSTLDAVQDDVTLDLDGVRVNLAGRAFDSSSLLRIDLYLASVSEPGEADPSEQM